MSAIRCGSMMHGLAVMLLCHAVATAGDPCWDGDLKNDAGSTLGGAQPTTGCGRCRSLDGNTGGTGPSLLPEDFEDVYIIEIIDPQGFCATTAGPGFADFDTQLWLFDGGGRGLLANNDGEPGLPGSTLTPNATDGTDVMLTEPGLYFLAISGIPNQPLAVDPAGTLGSIFEFDDPVEVSGPDGPGAESPLEAWSGPGEVGNYIIILTGATFANSEGACCEDLSGDGEVDASDLALVLGNWGSCLDCPTACDGALPDCPGDINADCSVNATDLGTLLGGWGACPDGCRTGADCDDGITCTADFCVAGQCQHGPLLCSDGIDCTIDFCVEGEGCVHQPEPLSCDDGNFCTQDLCTLAAGCENPLIAGAECAVQADCPAGTACVDCVCTQIP